MFQFCLQFRFYTNIDAFFGFFAVILSDYAIHYDRMIGWAILIYTRIDDVTSGGDRKGRYAHYDEEIRVD